MQRSQNKGRVIRRGETGFEEAVLGTSFTVRDPGRRPAIVVQANDVYEVIAALRQAQRDGLRVGICSGGHSWAQNHIRDGGMMLDLSRLRSIEVDPHARRAMVGPGCWGGELNAALVPHGLFFPVAHAYTVGLGGFLLQGGFGWNSPQLGIACENLVGIDVVLADGSLVHASETEHPQLFWSARGAGPGFFGAVVRFHLKLHARPKFIGLKAQIFRMQHLEQVIRWADRVGPQVGPQVEFQIVGNPKALGINAPGLEVICPVFADSWAQARTQVDFIHNSPVRQFASLTLPLVPLSLQFMMKTGSKMNSYHVFKREVPLF
jgi:hypothetical protein